MHVGFAKAGSTFLQKTLFSGDHPQIGVLGQRKPGGYLKSGEELFMNRLVVGKTEKRGVSPFDFDASATRELVYANADDSKPVVALSNEDWAGHPFSGGIYRHTIGCRIKESFPEAKILIVVREQTKMVLSKYAHFLTRGLGLLDLKAFLHPDKPNQIPLHQREFYLFSGMVNWYRETFGADRVLCLPLEMLARDQQGFLDRICAHCGVSTMEAFAETERQNTRDYRQYAAIRQIPLINYLAAPTPANGGAGLHMKLSRKLLNGLTMAVTTKRRESRIVQRDLEEIRRHFGLVLAQDNKRLQSMVDWSLADYRYDLPWDRDAA